MTTLVPAAARDLTPAQLTMVRETMAKDCNDREFNLFMAVCQRTGLDPIKRQISCMVHNKDKPDKRQLTIIVQIDGLRVIAKRSGDYRPMETAPLYEFDERVKDEATNPLGLVRVEVRAWKRYGDEWFPVVGEAYWSEFAPLKDEWQNNQKTGRKVLSGKWGDMPRLMLAKCAEAQALRRGWPDDRGRWCTWATTSGSRCSGPRSARRSSASSPRRDPRPGPPRRSGRTPGRRRGPPPNPGAGCGRA